MSDEYVIDPLPNKVIPLTMDTDARVTIRRKDSEGEPLDWASDVYMLVDVPGADTERIDAAIDGSLATMTIEAEVGNLCRKNTTWRVVRSVAGSPSFERPLLVGTFVRNDGKATL